jgi:hypothetical protein
VAATVPEALAATEPRAGFSLVREAFVQACTEECSRAQFSEALGTALACPGSLASWTALALSWLSEPGVTPPVKGRFFRDWYVALAITFGTPVSIVRDVDTFAGDVFKAPEQALNLQDKAGLGKLLSVNVSSLRTLTALVGASRMDSHSAAWRRLATQAVPECLGTQLLKLGDPSLWSRPVVGTWTLQAPARHKLTLAGKRIEFACRPAYLGDRSDDFLRMFMECLACLFPLDRSLSAPVIGKRGWQEGVWTFKVDVTQDMVLTWVGMLGYAQAAASAGFPCTKFSFHPDF